MVNSQEEEQACAPSSGPDAEKSKEYWDHVEPTVNGMLGGFSKIHHSDMDGSKKFLQHFFCLRKDRRERTALTENASCDPSSGPSVMKRCIDCGAGIGRITKHLLLPFADEVDLLEQSQTFLDRSTEYIGPHGSQRVINKYCHSLQSFIPQEGITYDCVWLQWVTGYLTDQELVDFLIKMSSCLDPDNGIIVVKDNTTRGEEEDADMNDSSVTRPKTLLLDIFKRASLEVVLQKRQVKMPRGLYPVYMFALKPVKSRSDNK